MNREIKFRVWYKPLNKMVQPDKLESINFDVKTLGVYMPIENKGFHKLRLSDFILMQYTGLKDKNGKEIYEGDVLMDVHGEGEVKWLQEHCSFIVKTIDPSAYHYLLSDGQLLHSEIVGNIYEDKP